MVKTIVCTSTYWATCTGTEILYDYPVTNLSLACLNVLVSISVYMYLGEELTNFYPNSLQHILTDMNKSAGH